MLHDDQQVCIDHRTESLQFGTDLTTLSHEENIPEGPFVQVCTFCIELEISVGHWPFPTNFISNFEILSVLFNNEATTIMGLLKPTSF